MAEIGQHLLIDLTKFYYKYAYTIRYVHMSLRQYAIKDRHKLLYFFYVVYLATNAPFVYVHQKIYFKGK